MKKASEIFAEVDPHLKVIDGGIHRNKRKHRVSTTDNWEDASGLRCPSCGEEVVQLVDSKCPWCYRKEEAERLAKYERKSEKRYYVYQLNHGRMTLTQMKNLRGGN